MSNLLIISSLVVAIAALAVALRNRRRVRSQAAISLERYSRLENALSHLQGGIQEQKESPAGVQPHLANPSLEQQLQGAQKHIENLRGELQNLTILPKYHPVRIGLCEELVPRMAPVVEKLVPVLFPNQIPLDDLDWMYRLPDRKFPYSLTFEEGMIIHHLVAGNQLTNGYEIATAFGMSSFFIALALQKSSGKLISVDAYIEEELEDFLYESDATLRHVQKLSQLQQEGKFDQLPRGLQFAQEGAKILNVDNVVDYKIGCSPEGIAELVGDQIFDFAFIDGGHFGEQPVRDIDGILPFLNRDRFLMMFHDTQCEAVAKAVHYAVRVTGGTMYPILTRNHLIAVAKGIDPATIDTCRDIVLRQYR